jgi:hypothetical protein
LAKEKGAKKEGKLRSSGCLYWAFFGEDWKLVQLFGPWPKTTHKFRFYSPFSQYFKNDAGGDLPENVPKTVREKPILVGN